MGLFERLGRQVEEFKQTARQTAEKSANYRCRDCGERYHTSHDECPECGSASVEQFTADE